MKILANSFFIFALSFLIVIVFKLTNSFALSPEYKKEIFEGCYLDATWKSSEKEKICTQHEQLVMDRNAPESHNKLDKVDEVCLRGVRAHVF